MINLKKNKNYRRGFPQWKQHFIPQILDGLFLSKRFLDGYYGGKFRCSNVFWRVFQLLGNTTDRTYEDVQFTVICCQFQTLTSRKIYRTSILKAPNLKTIV